MPELPTLAILMGAAFAGAFVQSAVGFGFALIAAPIFLAAMQSGSAMQVLVAIHVVQSAMLVPGLWRRAPKELLSPMLLGSLVGFPAGLFVFLALDFNTLKLTVGVVMLAFTAFLIAGERSWLSHLFVVRGPPHPAAAATVGASAGALTSVLVMPGPPLILYVAARRLGKLESRALSLTFFAFCYVMVTLLHAVWTGMSAETWAAAGALTPAVIIATLLGNRLAHRLSEARFRAAVLAISFLSGVWAIWSSL